MAQTTEPIGETGQTYNFVCFAALAYEFQRSDKKEVENKLKQKFKHYKFETYNQERVDYIRSP